LFRLLTQQFEEHMTSTPNQNTTTNLQDLEEI